MTRRRASAILWFACVLAILGCGGSVPHSTIDAKHLLLQGKYAQAREAVRLSESSSPQDRAIAALALLLQDPSRPMAIAAEATLAGAPNRSNAAEAALAMLETCFDLPEPLHLSQATMVAEVALGVVGAGPMAPQSSLKLQDKALASSLAIASSELLAAAFAVSPGEPFSQSSVLAIWNACFGLLGGDPGALPDPQAWRLYRAVARIALAVSSSDPESDLAAALLGSTVSIVERKPGLAVPVRCDVSSPFAELTAAVVHSQEFRLRLERSVATASGCTRGMYAP